MNFTVLKDPNIRTQTQKHTASRQELKMSFINKNLRFSENQESNKNTEEETPENKAATQKAQQSANQKQNVQSRNHER